MEVTKIARFTKLDEFAVSLYNKVGRNISTRDTHLILSNIEKVENNPDKLMEFYDNKVICKALSNKYFTGHARYYTAGNKFETYNKYLESPEGHLVNKLKGFVEKRDEELRKRGDMLHNTGVDSSSKGSTSGGNESDCKVIANNIYTINKGNPLGDSIEIELESRNKESKFTHFFRKIIHCNSAQLVKKIEEKERIDIIMSAARYYADNMPSLVAKDTRGLINKYDDLKNNQQTHPISSA